MEFEFDKEIDALLRQSARGETVFRTANPKSQIPNPKSQHLNADEISAFAENALPERAKQAATLHLADCENCRKTLSNLIRLSGEAEIETARVEEKPAEKQQIASPIPWYQKLFVFPNLAYTMGALVLVFSGIVVYTVLQNVGNSLNTEVSQTYEKQPNGKGMNSDGAAVAPESYSSNMTSNANMMMSNAASTNSTANTAANFSNPAMPSAPAAAMNSNAAAARRESSDKDASGESKSFAPQKETTDSVATQDTVVTGAPPPPPKPKVKEDDYQSDDETIRVEPSQTQQNSIVQNQTNIMPDSRNAQQRAPMATTLPVNGRRSKELQDSKEEQEKRAGTTSVGGKNFKRADNVWYDSAYRGQPTKNVTRGTGEYKKLDSGLRAIAENLGGTIVIVWKEKAYRIQ